MDRREFLQATGAVTGAALLNLAAPSAEAGGQRNPMRGHRLIFNQDCNDVDGTASTAPPGQRQAFIRDWYRRAFAAGAGVFIADVTTGPVVETKDTPTGEIIGARFPAEARQGIHWQQTIQELFAEGTDVLHLACEEARKAGVVILGGARMSDAHHGSQWQAESDNPLFPRIVMDHPEWCNTWQDGSRDATLNYAVPEVRAHYLQILREMATNYDIDGLELDWMRFCRHFPAGHQREYLDILSGFVDDVRAMLRYVAHRKGRDRLILGHRVAPTVEECLNIGCDVAAWAKGGCADFLAPMEFFHHDLDVRPEEFVKATEGTGCLVYPGFGQTKYSYSPRYPSPMRSLDEFRALAHNIYAWGGTGASVFNMYLWKPEEHEFRSQAIAILSDPELALSGPRHYLYVPLGGGVGPTGTSHDQVLTFGADSVGRRQAFAFRMADGRDGEELHGLLRFRIYDASPHDGFDIDLNGKPIAREKLKIDHQPEGEVSEEPSGAVTLPGSQFTWPGGLRFEVALEDCPRFRGDNELGITLTERGDSAGPDPTMEALEVKVTG